MTSALSARLCKLETKTSDKRPRRWVRIVHHPEEEAEAVEQLRADGYDTSPGSKDFVISPLFPSLLDGPNELMTLRVLTAGDRSSPPTESELRDAEEFKRRINALAARIRSDQ